jgi:hypothetical protein
MEYVLPLGFWMGVMSGDMRHHSYHTRWPSVHRHTTASTRDLASHWTGALRGRNRLNHEYMPGVRPARVMLRGTPASQKHDGSQLLFSSSFIYKIRKGHKIIRCEI